VTSGIVHERTLHARDRSTGCQKAIAAKIVDGKGDYVLALKGNQEQLFEDAQFVMLCHMQHDFVGCPVSRHVEVEQGYGRLEARTYYHITGPSHLRGRSEWKGLKTNGAAVRVYEENGVEKRDIRCSALNTACDKKAHNVTDGV
jgi:hypothetical protein